MTYTATRRPAQSGLPPYWAVRLTNGARTPGAVVKATGADDLSRQPPRELLTDYVDRLQASVVVNASGWWGDAASDGDLMGAQITDGKIVKDWEPHSTQSWVGTRAAAIMADGSLRAYNLNTPVAEMLADGVVNTFSQGAVVLVDGQPTSFVTSLTYAPVSARVVLADDHAGHLHLIVVPGKSGTAGVDGPRLVDLLAPYGLRTAVLLDGGGSTQLAIDGKVVLRSSDATPRRIPDVLALYAPRVGWGAEWVPILDRGAGWAEEEGLVRYRVTPDRVEVTAQARWTGAAPARLAPVAALPEDIPRPPGAWPEYGYNNGAPQQGQNCRVSSAGSIDLSASAPGTVYATFSYPVS